ncbi:MAG TPA: zf-HC2 domain-containing protein [Ktedonobacteraceae bacterium]|nr:zf-HC2 domain-containing protein [Ktedonobacteraceae bacterium]
MTNASEPTHALTCQEVVELVTDYLEQTLLPQTLAVFQAHLAECDDCTTYTNQIQQTITMLRNLAQEPVFPTSRQELLTMFQSWKSGK